MKKFLLKIMLVVSLMGGAGLQVAAMDPDAQNRVGSPLGLAIEWGIADSARGLEVVHACKHEREYEQFLKNFSDLSKSMQSFISSGSSLNGTVTKENREQYAQLRENLSYFSKLYQNGLFTEHLVGAVRSEKIEVAEILVFRNKLVKLQKFDATTHTYPYESFYDARLYEGIRNALIRISLIEIKEGAYRLIAAVLKDPVFQEFGPLCATHLICKCLGA